MYTPLRGRGEDTSGPGQKALCGVHILPPHPPIWVNGWRCVGVIDHVLLGGAHPMGGCGLPISF